MAQNAQNPSTAKPAGGASILNLQLLRLDHGQRGRGQSTHPTTSRARGANNIEPVHQPCPVVTRRLGRRGRCRAAARPASQLAAPEAQTTLADALGTVVTAPDQLPGRVGVVTSDPVDQSAPGRHQTTKPSCRTNQPTDTGTTTSRPLIPTRSQRHNQQNRRDHTGSSRPPHTSDKAQTFHVTC